MIQSIEKLLFIKYIIKYERERKIVPLIFLRHRKISRTFIDIWIGKKLKILLVQTFSHLKKAVGSSMSSFYYFYVTDQYCTQSDLLQGIAAYDNYCKEI